MPKEINHQKCPFTQRQRNRFGEHFGHIQNDRGIYYARGIKWKIKYTKSLAMGIFMSLLS